MTLISVCIATHERPQLVAATLEGLGRQTRLPDEIIVSDSSSPINDDVVAAFSARHPAVPIRHVPSTRKALPWHRWWAFKHSRGDVVLFLDDDVTLAPEALESLERAYSVLGARPDRRIAGIGLLLFDEKGSPPERAPSSLRERWLRMSYLRGGSFTKGGLTVSLGGLNGQTPIEVDVLSGAAMSFRREALAATPLDNLVSLYEAGIGRSEDAVLSSYARRLGKLFILTEHLAIHRREENKGATPYAKAGWRLGLTHTFGRAHTMRWMAADQSAYKQEWCRYIVLELARCVKELARRPWRGRDWLRLAGACYGICLTLLRWKQIPPTARSGALTEHH